LTDFGRFSIERLAGTPSPACNTPLLGGGTSRDSLDTALDHRSSVTRFLRWTHPALGLLGLTALVLSGCRSNDQQDLIARELRMQEDQLYAMEDYISQYQQLVCKYRSENAALRRQMAGDSYEGDVDELPRPDPSVRPSDERRGPTFRAPQTPRRSGEASEGTQIEVPEVPPLEGSTSTQDKYEVAPASYNESSKSDNDSDGAATSTRLSSPKSVAVEELVTNHSSTADQSSKAVSLRGEVIANDSGGGPRLMVDVTRLDPSGNGAPFDGTLSLLLLERGQENVPQNLARWDFSTDDIREAAEPSAGEHAMRFYLELPGDSATDNPTEVWVRLLPRDGAKLLAHAEIDLRQPSYFVSNHASGPTGIPQAAPLVTTSPITNESASVSSSGGSNSGKGEWTSARTDQLARLANETDTGKWRASSEPMPVVQSSFATAPVSRPVQRAAFFDNVQATKTLRTYARPTWSPDRSQSAARRAENGAGQRKAVSQRPVWSDTR
jgi:hypothetical protein